MIALACWMSWRVLVRVTCDTRELLLYYCYAYDVRTTIYYYVVACIRLICLCTYYISVLYLSVASIATCFFYCKLRRNMLNAIDKNPRRGGRKIQIALK